MKYADPCSKKCLTTSTKAAMIRRYLTFLREILRLPSVNALPVANPGRTVLFFLSSFPLRPFIDGIAGFCPTSIAPSNHTTYQIAYPRF